jgi:hypothetical protein
MRLTRKHLFDNLAIFSASFAFAVIAISFSGSVSFRTADDTKLLEGVLFQQKTQVKGAYSGNNLCPTDQPIVGWIDFEGNKKVVENLPKNQSPSACFKTIEEAKKEGFLVE